MKVLLVQPQATDSYPGATQPHPGLAYLAAILLQADIEINLTANGLTSLKTQSSVT